MHTFGSCAPNSKTAEEMSKNLGKQTVLSGSVSRSSGNGGGSRQLQMIECPLMTVDELKSMPKGNFIVMKTGCYPMKTRLPIFLKWAIRFENPYTIEEKSARKVHYADRCEVEAEIIKAYPPRARQTDPVEFSEMFDGGAENEFSTRKHTPRTRKG